MKDRFIYKLTNDRLYSYYIGMTTDITRRFREHKHHAHIGKKTLLCQFMRDYGVKNWKIKILFRIPDCNQVNAIDIEQFFIRCLNPTLNKAIRKVSNIGMKMYSKEWYFKNRLDEVHRCNYCDLNCACMRQLINHRNTNKHKRNVRNQINSMLNI